MKNRRLWYPNKHKIRRLRILLCLTVVVVSLIFLWCLADITLYPHAQKNFEDTLREYSFEVTEQILEQELSSNGPNNLVQIQKDGQGNITSINTNSVELGKITEAIKKTLKSDLIEDKLHNPKLTFDEKLTYKPLNLSLGKVKISNIYIKYDSSFLPDSIKGTRHKITLEYAIKYNTIKGMNTLEYNYILWDNLMPEYRVSK